MRVSATHARAANVLLLRGSLTLRPECPYVTTEALCAMLGHVMLEAKQVRARRRKLSLAPKPCSCPPQSSDDPAVLPAVMENMPTLLAGMDVDIKFDS